MASDLYSVAHEPSYHRQQTVFSSMNRRNPNDSEVFRTVGTASLDRMNLGRQATSTSHLGTTNDLNPYCSSVGNLVPYIFPFKASEVRAKADCRGSESSEELITDQIRILVQVKDDVYSPNPSVDYQRVEKGKKPQYEMLPAYESSKVRTWIGKPGIFEKDGLPYRGDKECDVSKKTVFSYSSNESEGKEGRVIKYSASCYMSDTSRANTSRASKRIDTGVRNKSRRRLVRVRREASSLCDQHHSRKGHVDMEPQARGVAGTSSFYDRERDDLLLSKLVQRKLDKGCSDLLLLTNLARQGSGAHKVRADVARLNRKQLMEYEAAMGDQKYVVIPVNVN